MQAFRELRRHKTAVIYLPNIDRWWFHVTENVKQVFMDLLHSIRHDSNMVLATCECEPTEIDEGLKFIFSSSRASPVGSWKTIYPIPSISRESYRNFFKKLLEDVDCAPADEVIPVALEANQICPLAPVEITDNLLTPIQQEQLFKEEEQHRRLARQCFGGINEELRKLFRGFCKPSREMYPNYIVDIPMDLVSMEEKLQKNVYELPHEYLADIQIIVKNAQELNEAYIPAQNEQMIKVILFLW